VDSVHEREPIGIFVGLQRGFMHETANGEVCHQQSHKTIRRWWYAMGQEVRLPAGKAATDRPGIRVAGKS
jgi:hypothetical protein